MQAPPHASSFGSRAYWRASLFGSRAHPRASLPGARASTLQPVRSVALVLGSVAVVCCTRFVLDAWLADHLPYILFIGAVAAATRWGGFRLGVATMALSLVAGSYFFTDQTFSSGPPALDVIVDGLVFVLVSLLVAGTLRAETRARIRLELAHQTLQAEHEKRLQLERDLAAIARLESIGQLAGGIAHDFNNLLTIILGSADLLKLKWPEEGALDPLVLAAERGADLTKQLLRFARREAVRLRPLSIQRSLAESMLLAARLLPEDILVSVESSAALWRIDGDPTLVQQVFLNLLTNARDAMPGGGEIVITACNERVSDPLETVQPLIAAGEYVKITVRDTGTGLNREMLQHVFEPFFTTKMLGQGTGLGLAVVYGIVKQLRGYIFAQSEPGAGTTFDIWWPRSTSPEEPEAAGPSLPKPRPAQRGPLTLLVEDDASVRSVTAKLLETLGHRVQSEGDPRVALEMLSDPRVHFDIVVTDVVMPHLNGKELADHAARLRPGMPVVLISGYNDHDLLRRGQLPNGVTLIRKPFTLEGLAMALEHIQR